MNLTAILSALFLPAAVLLMGVVVIIVLKRKWAERAGEDSGADIQGPWPFYSKKPLSPVEQVFYFRLLKALPECIVLAQVPLSRFLGVTPGNNFQAWMNRINRMSVDYLICLKDTTIVAAIEIDDKTHDRPDRKLADEKKNKALGAAGITLIRWQAQALPDEAEIRATFTQ